MGPGGMFANSIRARAQSHGHAHDCRHGHAHGIGHGHKKTYLGIPMGIAHGYSHGHAHYILAVPMTLSIGTQKFTILSISIILQEWKVTIMLSDQLWTTISNNSFQTPKLLTNKYGQSLISYPCLFYIGQFEFIYKFK